MKDSVQIEDILNKEKDTNLVYYLNHSELERDKYIFIYDINSVNINVPNFIKIALTETKLAKLKETNGIDLLEDVQIVLFKDSAFAKNISYKNSVIIGLHTSKIEKNQVLKYIEKESLDKSLKVFDLKNNFNPSTYDFK